MRLLALLLLFSTCAYPVTSQYDHTIKKWASVYTPTVDWRLLKSQFYQESGLRHNVVSPVGAGGLSQIMPKTWSELESKLKIKGSRFEPSLSIQFGVYYMAQMLNGWTPAGRTHEDHIKLAQASYNAGIGNIYKSQKKANGAMSYDAIINQLHKITGAHHTETVNYVVRIWQLWQELVLN